MRIPSRAWKPSTAQYLARHMPIPATSMIALGTAIENSDGRLPSMVSPAA